MKKIALGLLTLFSVLILAQNYPDYYPSNGGYDNGYYSDADDQYYFPDDYYYQYPNDYYTNDFYRSSYNDYERSINGINWDRFFAQNRLSPSQIQQIMYLNQMYSSYDAWNSYYRYNPDRWYYDRFFALQNILGPQVFVVFQNAYYGGYSPVVYYRNYRIRHYAPVVYVMPRYRNVNINLYRVNRNDFHRSNGYFYNPRSGFGFKDAPRSGSVGGFRNNSEGFRGAARNQNSDQGGFRNQSPSIDNSGIRNNQGNNGGFRGSSETPRQNTPSRERGNKGFRGQQNSGERIQQRQQKSAPSNGRASGQRFASR